MKNKTLLMLGGAALLLAIAVALMTKGRAAESTEDRAPKAAATRLLPEARDQMSRITRVHLRRGAVETTLEQREKDGKPEWVIASKDGYPAEGDKVRKYVGDLLDASIVEPKTSKADLYERIGVSDTDKPGASGSLVELSDSAGKPLGAVIVGNASQISAGEGAEPRFFVRRKGEAQSYLASGALNVTPEPMSWAQRTVVDVEASKVKSARIMHKTEGGRDEVVAVSKAAAADPKFTIEGIPEGREVKDEYAAARVAQALASVQMDDVAPAAGVDLNNPDTVAEFRTFDGMLVTALQVTKDGKKWWAFNAAYEAPPAAGAPAPAAADATPAAPGSGVAAPTPAETAAADAAAKAKVDADKAQQAEATATQAKVAELNKKLSGWVYALPAYKQDGINLKMEELLKPAAAAAPTPGTPGAPLELKPSDTTAVPLPPEMPK